MTLLDVLESVGKFAVATGLLVWLIRSIVTQLLARDLVKYKGDLGATHAAEVERLKADLRAAAFEHETRYGRLHEERVRVISQLYKRLVRVERALYAVAAAELNIAADEKEHVPQEELSNALNAKDSFVHYFAENRIYFDESLCIAIDALVKRFYKLWVHHALGDFGRRSLLDERDPADDLDEVRHTLTDLRVTIESKVRSMLGVSDDSLTTD